jgi:transcriptional regulator with XRE-family HTH domain
VTTNGSKSVPQRSPKRPDSAYIEYMKQVAGPQATDIRTLSNEELDRFYEVIRDHRFEDTTTLLGYWLLSAQRDLNLTQSDVADRVDISRGHISSLLRERSTSLPETFTRIARATGHNPLDMMLVLGYINRGDVLSYQLPHSEDWLPIAERLDKVPRSERRKAVALINEILNLMEEQLARDSK